MTQILPQRSPPIFYLHIPKTGGQTVATRIASAFRPNDVYILNEDIRYPEDAEKFTNITHRCKFIEAHIAGPLLSHFADLRIICTVRDPVERLISSHRHIRREPRDRLHRAAMTMTPRAFFANFSDLLSNYQPRTIVSAFKQQPEDVLLHDKTHRWLTENLYECMERIHWLAPSEWIDDFISFFSMDIGRAVPQSAIVVNEAPADNVDLVKIRNSINENQELCSLDSEL